MITASDPFRAALATLPAEAAVVANDLARSASALAARLLEAGDSVSHGADPLQGADTGLEQLVAVTWALLVAPVQASGPVRRVVSDLAVAAGTSRSPNAPVAAAALARYVVSTAAASLALQRLDVFESLAGAARTNGYRPPIGVLCDPYLRHLAIFQDGAGTAFDSHRDWLLARAWRSSVGVLCRDGALQDSLAEADVLACMLTVARGADRGVYCAGLDADERIVVRTHERLLDPAQRTVLARLFGTEDSELDARMEQAFEGLKAGRMSTSFPRRFFDVG